MAPENSNERDGGAGNKPDLDAIARNWNGTYDALIQHLGISLNRKARERLRTALRRGIRERLVTTNTADLDRTIDIETDSDRLNVLEKMLRERLQAQFQSKSISEIDEALSSLPERSRKIVEHIQRQKVENEWRGKSIDEIDAAMPSALASVANVLRSLILAKKDGYRGQLSTLPVTKLRKLKVTKTWQQELVAAEIQRKQRRRETMRGKEAYYSRNGPDSAAFTKRLERTGPLGMIAAQLFRAQKASEKAKLPGYRRAGAYGRSFSSFSYEAKEAALNTLVSFLAENNVEITWGWGEDASQPHARWVLYVELPTGQVSFHSPTKFTGPDYANEWDGSQQSVDRILKFCDNLLDAAQNQQLQQTELA
jgi:hypothetical protein